MTADLDPVMFTCQMLRSLWLRLNELQNLITWFWTQLCECFYSIAAYLGWDVGEGVRSDLVGVGAGGVDVPIVELLVLEMNWGKLLVGTLDIVGGTSPPSMPDIGPRMLGTATLYGHSMVTIYYHLTRQRLVIASNKWSLAMVHQAI